jgi:Ca2+-dependent lipid-binding protein, contains C2 domain
MLGGLEEPNVEGMHITSSLPCRSVFSVLASSQFDNDNATCGLISFPGTIDSVDLTTSILFCLQSVFGCSDVTLNSNISKLDHRKNSGHGNASTAIGVIRVTVQSAHIFKSNKFLLGSPDPFVCIRIRSHREHTCTKYRHRRCVSRSFYESLSILTCFLLAMILTGWRRCFFLSILWTNL